jgi:phage terminase large subunit-like protein
LNISPEESAGVDRWLSLAEWDTAADASLTLEALIAECRYVYIGVDAGGLDDLSAIGVLGKTADGRYLFWSHQWISRRGYEKRKSVNPYDDWIAAGELTLFEGGGGDIAGFVEVVELVAGAGKLSLIGIDAYGATELAEAFLPFGVDVEACPQGWRLTPALSWVERRLADGVFRHNGSGLLRWNVGNAVVTRNGNAVSISKATVVGAGKIDGVAALLNGTTALLARAAADVPSVYESRGLIVLDHTKPAGT